MPKITITIGIDDNGPDFAFEDESAYLLLVCADIGLDGCPKDFASEEFSASVLHDVRYMLTRYEEVQGEERGESPT